MNNDTATAIWNQYQNGLNYFDRAGLSKEWLDCENFYEGKQWPNKTKKTKNLPRPVVNICSMIADNKKAGILSEKIKLIFNPTEMFGEKLESAVRGSNIFTKFAENISKEMHLDELDDEAIDFATQLGTYVYHFYWDKEITGGMETPYVGGLRGEIIHPKNVIVSNARQQNIQKQKYIIIASIESLSSVKELAKKNGVLNVDEIVADHEIEDEATKELEVCTVLTKYSRKNGKVIWSKSTKNVLIQEPTEWEPNTSKIELSDEEINDEGSELSEPDKTIKENKFTRKQLYPIVMKPHKKRKNCIYGIGEVAQAIPNNKAVNFNLALMLLSVQQTAWPKIIQKAGALARQVITNAPGEVLTDNTRGQNWGFKYMEPTGFSSQALTLTDTLINLTRTTTGSSEVVTGEVMGANMAASAIIALQNQAKKPIEIYQKSFFNAHIEIGKIFEQFFKYYYKDDRLFSYEDDNQTIVDSMNGGEFSDIEFSTSIDVGTSGVFSESLCVSLLDSMKQAGDIDFDEYIELYPESIMVFKSQLKKMRQKKLEEQKLLEEQMMNNPPIVNQELNQQSMPVQPI
ncbi:MAG: hypothetical protein HFE81_03515 [Bacilli bacterium]|nr:hypothetical protein [Bacilli bacterium]